MERGRRVVKRKFDNSTIGVYKECPRKYYWRHVKGLVPAGGHGSAPLAFGSSIHLALDTWYGDKDDAKALKVFDKDWDVTLDDGKRTTGTGHRLLKMYFNRYRDAPIELIASEMEFVLPFGDYEYWGRIDKVLSWDCMTWVMDHKTTSGMNDLFFAGANPNFQFEGYVWAAQQLGYKCNGFVLDGMLVAKTKADVARDRFYVTEKQLARWANHTTTWMDRASGDKQFPMNDQNCTSYFTKCPYMKLCRETEKRVLDSMLENEYVYEPWEPKEVTNAGV